MEELTNAKLSDSNVQRTTSQPMLRGPNSGLLNFHKHLYLSGVEICGSKDECQKCISLEELNPHAQNLSTILGSILNLVGGTYMIIYDYFTLIRNKTFICTPIIMRKMATASNCIC